MSFFDKLNNINQVDFEQFLSSLDSDIGDFDLYQNSFDGGIYFKQYKNIKEVYDDAITLNESNTLRQYPTYEDFNNMLYDVTPKISSAIDVMDEMITDFKDIINLGGLYEKDKIIVTQDERGIFDFSLASQGLYRPVEFYSQDFENKLLDSGLLDPFRSLGTEIGVVPANKVKNTSKDTFTFEWLGKSYLCEKRQIGATKVEKEYGNECFLKLTPDEKIKTTYFIDNPIKVFNGGYKAKLKYASTNKKCYLIYNQKSASAKYVDFYVPANYLNVKDKFTLMSILPQMMAASFLEKYGIQTRISILRVGSNERKVDSAIVSVAIPVKEYGESAKDAYPKLFNFCANQQVVQTIMADVKNLLEQRENLPVQTQPVVHPVTNIGRLHMGYTKYAYMVQILERYKNFLKQNPQLDFTKVIDTNFMNVDSLSTQSIDPSFINDRTNFKESDLFKGTTLHFILFRFYFQMDFIAFDLNTMKDFVAAIKKRFNENDYFRKLFTINQQNIDQTMLTYIRDILKLKYIGVEGNSRSYADSPAELNELDEKFDSKIEELEEIF